MNNLHPLVKKDSLNTYQNIFNIVNICAALDLFFLYSFGISDTIECGYCIVIVISLLNINKI